MSKIKMGDDEFILYIRKNYPNCTMLNNTLGSLISKWFKDRSVFVEDRNRDILCHWNTRDDGGNKLDKVDGLLLPETATQFEFDRGLLPQLYSYLDQLGRNNN